MGIDVSDVNEYNITYIYTEIYNEFNGLINNVFEYIITLLYIFAGKILYVTYIIKDYLLFYLQYTIYTSIIIKSVFTIMTIVIIFLIYYIVKKT